MKSTGIVRKFDSLGRLVVPVELRRVLGLEIGDPVEVLSEGNTIVLRKFQPGCDACGNTEIAKVVGKVKLCGQCVSKVSQNG